MSAVTAITVRLSRPWALRRVTLAQVLTPVAPGHVHLALAAFRLTPREERFARRLITRCPQWWVWRTHQRRFAGDFVLVDMSCPVPAHRIVWVVDLKLGAPLRLGGGGCGVQLRNAPDAAQELVDARVVGEPPAVQLATGGATQLLELCGAGPV